MIAAGVDPTEGEHFEKVDSAYKGYSVLADEAAQIEAKLNRLLEIEGISGKAPMGEPKRPLAGDPENFDRVFVGREAGQPHDCLGECFEFHVVSGNKKAPGDTSPLAGRKHPAGAVGESHRGVPR